MTVRLSSKGQIAIPARIRQQLNLRQGTELSITVEGEGLILRKLLRRNWKQWEGAFADLDLLGERARQRRQELKRDAQRVKV
jgi:AbrB family looped-hinge helix DNA binding protein